MHSRPASELSWAELAALITKAFEGYFSPVNHTAETLEPYCEAFFIDLSISHVFYPDEQATDPVAFVIFAVRDDRPGEARVAAMGVVPTYQAKGTGSAVLQQAIEAERKRGTKALELECIDKNERGVRLYSRAGFKMIRELWGFKTDASGGEPVLHSDLQSCALEEVDAVIAAHGVPNLPYQARGFIKLVEGGVAFRLDHAYCVINDPDAGDEVKVWSLIVEPEWRGKGQAKRLVEAMVAKFPNKKFDVRPLFPREYVEPLLKYVKGEAYPVYQYHMRLDLE
ncbi:acetyltransferase (GNAT) family protein [Sarocladium implicatum]|jgi:GNAT superfamily N-acetyltransferase|nr:acetyltransferase (GNAT) family protein [Sarocladium implicatum]